MSTLITNEQMRICNNLFDLGFSYKSISYNGQITLSKKTISGLVVLILSKNGLINGKLDKEFFNFYTENGYMMSQPEPIEIIPSRF